MSDLSRRDVLKAGAVSGIAGIGVGGLGTVSAQPGHIVIDDLLGTNNVSGNSTECAATVSPSSDSGTHSTIQGAIDDVSGSSSADPDDPSTFTIICIEEGTYEENVTVDKPGIALASTGSGDGTVITADGTVVDSTAEWTVLFDLTISAHSGPAVDAGPRTVVQQSSIRTADTVGIDATSHIFAIGNDFLDVGEKDQQGIGLRANGVRGDSESCGGNNPNPNNGGFISRNTFSNHRQPVRITDSTEILVRANAFNLARYTAVYVESTGTTRATECIAIQGNTFNQNANGVILFENPDGGRIKAAAVTGNSLENHSWGILTSHQKVPFDYDNDGQDEQVEAPGALRGGTVAATCNWWDDPRGPNASNNALQSGSFVPKWAIPRAVKQASPGPDRTVEDGVDYRPWAIQRVDPGNDTICKGTDGSGGL